MSTKALLDEALEKATIICWDGCHKIYLALDEEQADLFRTYRYDDEEDHLLVVEQTPAGRTAAADKLRQWWTDSCGLRFISTVRSVKGDPNHGFDDIIAQGKEWT